VEASLSAVTRTSATCWWRVAVAHGWDKRRTRRVFASALAEEPGCYHPFRFGYRGADPPTPPIWSGAVWPCCAS